MPPPRAFSDARRRGFSLLELLCVLVLVGVMAGIGASGLRSYREAAALHAAERAVRAHLTVSRMTAIRDRRVVRIRLSPEGTALVLYDHRDEVLRRTSLAPGGVELDSVRLRPRTLRYNARGQAGPGSVYLYHRGRGVRIVSNFLGRLRVERFR